LGKKDKRLTKQLEGRNIEERESLEKELSEEEIRGKRQRRHGPNQGMRGTSVKKAFNERVGSYQEKAQVLTVAVPRKKERPRMSSSESRETQDKEPRRMGR